MRNDIAEFVGQLITTSPELSEVHRQHLADQDELLPHVLMGAITRLVIERAVSREPVDWLAKLLQRLEDGLTSGNEEIAELIAVSFVENLCGENTTIETIHPMMGAALRREVKAICGVRCGDE